MKSLKARGNLFVSAKSKRRFAECISKFMFGLLGMITLHFSILVFRYVYSVKNKTKFVVRSMFVVYLLYIVLLLLRFGFAYYCLKKDQTDVLFKHDFYIYLFTVVTFNKKKFIIISVVGLILHCANVFTYCFFKLIEYFVVEIEDLYRIGCLCSRYNFTIIDCLLTIRSLEVIKRRLRVVSKYYSIMTNPFMGEADYYEQLKLLKLVELNFMFWNLVLVLCSVITLPLIRSHYMSLYRIEQWSLKMFLGRVDLIFGIGGLSFIGVWAPWSLLHMSCMLLHSLTLPWNRYSSNIMRDYCRLKAHMSFIKLFGLVLKLRHGQRMFLHILKEVILFNNKGIGKVFALSVICSLVANIVFVVELLIGQSKYIFKFWLVILIIFEVCLTLSSIIFFIKATERLYRPSYHYLLLQIFISKHKCQVFLVRFVKLSLFIETIRPKKRFYFTLGALGRISRRTVYGFLPVYSSIIMSILPLVLRYETSRMQIFM